MPNSKDVLIGQAQALEDAHKVLDAEMREHGMSIYPATYAINRLNGVAAELRAQAAALPDVQPDQGAVIAEAVFEAWNAERFRATRECDVEKSTPPFFTASQMRSFEEPLRDAVRQLTGFIRRRRIC